MKNVRNVAEQVLQIQPQEVCADEFEFAMGGKACQVSFLEVTLIIVEEIIYADDLMAFDQQFLRQMGADKSGNSRHY